MKHSFSLLVFLLFGSVFETQAQAPALAGVVFANAIGVNANADIVASGKKLTKKGIEPGMATSGLGLPVGNYQMQVTAPGCEPATLPLQIAIDATPILVAYLERVSDPRTNTIKNCIRLMQLAVEPQSEKYVINAISVDPNATFNVTVGGQTQAIVFRKPVKLDGKSIKVVGPGGSTAEAAADQ